MFDVITFGAGSIDIYLMSKKFIAKSDKICVLAGSKNEVEDIMMFSGGGGTNAAATFAKQGFDVAYCGLVGEDYFGDSVVGELRKLRVDTSLVFKTKEKSTNVSVLLACPGEDRTILVYRGASDLLGKKDIPWPKLKNAKWFYLAPLGGKSAGLTDDLVRFAKKNGIKVAFNPGYNQLSLRNPVLEKILSKVDVLILNEKEAAQVAGIATKGIVVTTKGGEGAAVSDGKFLYEAPSLISNRSMKFAPSGLPSSPPSLLLRKSSVIDTTGAGDAFGSGFVAGLIQKNDIVFAIQLAMANSGYNLTKWGAKDGLLSKNQKWPKIKVVKEDKSSFPPSFLST